MSTVDSAPSTRFWEVSEERGEEFKAKGYELRYFFPHRIVRLHRPGPDGYALAVRMCGVRDLDRLWELVIYGAPSVVREFPDELFFDPDLAWHQQHFGQPGQIAYANVVLDGERAWSFTHVADVVQRIGRRREHKTRVDNAFRGWPRMVLNAVAHFARQQGARELRTPTSELAMENTDLERTVQPELFERVYDRSLRQLDGARRDAGWWVTDLARNADRIVAPEPRQRPLARPERLVCLCHDLERGLGHRDVEPEFARQADAEAPRSLLRMLAAEREAEVRATYSVAGMLLDEVRPELESGGHCLAFHSYDHGDGELDQLSACREVDYRLKGYRSPRSRIGPDLSDERLAHHDFEWLASSSWSFGFDEPQLRRGIVRMPIHLDDFSLHADGRDYEDWEREALQLVERQPVTAISLHDCYGPHWLPRYPALLEKLRARAELRTVDELSAEILLGSAV